MKKQKNVSSTFPSQSSDEPSLVSLSRNAKIPIKDDQRIFKTIKYELQ